MSEDQRWLEGVILLQTANAKVDDDPAEFIRLYNEHLNMLERIASDSNADEHDRAEAQAILDEVMVLCRAAIPDALRVLGQIARNPCADPHDHDEAMKMLKHAAEQMPVASDKKH